ncbi:hypothetical protein T484DRAFT_3642543, partial [Baffinella frigidus]
CNSHYVSHFAAFFIVVGAKTSAGKISPGLCDWIGVVMILPQVHLRKPCYDFTFL